MAPRGNLRGEPMTSWSRYERAGDGWLLLHDDQRVVLRTWDGSQVSESAGNASLRSYACGNRVLLVDGDALAMRSLDLSASASGGPPQPQALPSALLGVPRFVAGCSKAVVSNGIAAIAASCLTLNRAQLASSSSSLPNARSAWASL
jgi:hypothetical protein